MVSSLLRRKLLGLGCCLAMALGAFAIAGCGDDGNDTGGQSGTASTAKKEYTIGFVTVDARDEFWADTMKGAKQADEASDEIKVIAQAGGAQIEAMVPVIENMLTRGVDALVVTGIPQIKAVIKRAGAQGVPVISYGNDLPELNEIKSTVATDNFAAGLRAGEFIKEKLGGKGELALLDIARGTYIILDQRIQGLKEALQGTDIKIVSQIDTGCDVSKSVSVTQNILSRNPKVNAIFGACAQAILGAERALKQANRSPDDVITVGYDAKDPELEAIKAGTQDATVAQFPVKMGELGVLTALKVLKGERVPDLIDTGSELITAENVATFQSGRE